VKKGAQSNPSFAYHRRERGSSLSIGARRGTKKGNSSITDPYVLDLKEMTVVDMEMVRFLGECKADRVKIVHCSPYIRKWMARERRP
jgi:hypothetical protein